MRVRERLQLLPYDVRVSSRAATRRGSGARRHVQSRSVLATPDKIFQSTSSLDESQSTCLAISPQQGPSGLGKTNRRRVYESIAGKRQTDEDRVRGLRVHIHGVPTR